MFVQVPHYGHCTSSFLLVRSWREVRGRGPGHAGHPMQESTHGSRLVSKGYEMSEELVGNHRTQSSREAGNPLDRGKCSHRARAGQADQQVWATYTQVLRGVQPTFCSSCVEQLVKRLRWYGKKTEVSSNIRPGGRSRL